MQRLFFLFSLIGTTSFFVFYFFNFSQEVPDCHPLKDYNPSVVSRLYSKNRSVFAEYSKENRLFIPISMISQNVRAAFISAEDKNFYSHFGVDFIGIIRALIRNIYFINNNKRPHGASTITQQVARNFLLSKTSNIVSYQRKIKEIILAFKIEKIYSKDHILELYLNQIYLGNGSYGVSSAALHYFNKGLEDLTICESALLAGLPKAPSYYNPYKNLDKALGRKNFVISRMLEENFQT